MRGLIKVLLGLTLAALSFTDAFILKDTTTPTSRRAMTTSEPNCAGDSVHPFAKLPGDPSLILTTNVDLGDKKLEIMKACSKAINAATGKPESYIGVCINDNASVIFGGSDEPAALGCVYSIGAIAMESNGKIQASVTSLLEPYGVDGSRIYINFFDMPRANVGWSSRTFAG